jgi:hypothetical protein
VKWTSSGPTAALTLFSLTCRQQTSSRALNVKLSSSCNSSAVR